MSKFIINSAMINMIVCNKKWAAAAACLLVSMKKNDDDHYDIVFAAYKMLFFVELDSQGSYDDVGTALEAYLIEAIARVEA